MSDNFNLSKLEGIPEDREFVITDAHGERHLIVSKGQPHFAGNPIAKILDIEAKTRTRLRDGEDPFWFCRFYKDYKEDPGSVQFGEYCRNRQPKRIEWLEASPGGEKNQPLTPTEQAVYDLIPTAPNAIQGPEIARLCKLPIEPSTLTRHIIPSLKSKRGIMNRKGSGYYRPAT